MFLPPPVEGLSLQAIEAAEDIDKVGDILLNWYNPTIKLDLTAGAVDDSLLQIGYFEFLPWHFQVEKNGLSDRFNSQVNDGFDLIAAGLRNAIDKGNERCLAEEDWRMFAEVDRWFAAAAQRNLDTAERRLDLETLQPDFCVKVVFEEIAFPEEIEAEEEVEFSTKIGWKIGSGPIRHDPGIRLEATFIGSSRVEITETGVTGDTGGFSTTVHMGADSNEIEAKIVACFRGVLLACSADQAVAQGRSGMALKARTPDETDADLGDEICVANGGQARLVAFLTKGRGGLAGRSIQFSLDGQGSLDSASAFTDIDGRASVEFTAPDTGSGVTKSTASFQETSDSQSDSLDIEFGGLLRVIPGNTTLSPGDTVTFTVSRCGPGSSDVVWSATGGAIAPSGLYTAGSNAGVFAVTASSLADSSQSAQGAVVIQGPRPLRFGGGYKGTSSNIGFWDGLPCGGSPPPCLSVVINQSTVDGSTVISLFWCGHISFALCNTSNGSSCRILYEGTANGNQITVNAVQWLDLCGPSRQPNRLAPVGTVTATLVDGTLSGTLAQEGADPTTFSVTLQ